MGQQESALVEIADCYFHFSGALRMSSFPLALEEDKQAAPVEVGGLKDYRS